MDLGETLSSSWKVFWKYKLLWLFGIVPFLVYLLPIMVSLAFFKPQFLSGSPNNLITNGFIIFGILYLLLMVIYLFVYVLTDTSIIRGTLLFDQKGEKPTTRELIKQSLPFYWRVFGLYAIFAGLFIFGMVALGAFMFLIIIASMGMGALCIFPLYLLIIPVSLLGAAFLELSRTSIVNENYGIGECLKRGWALFKAKFWKIVLMALILNFGLFLINMILALPLYVLFFIPTFLNLAQNATTTPEFPVNFFSSMRWLYLIFIPIYSLLNGILNTFIREAWAVTYLRLSKLPAAASLSAVPPLQLNGSEI